MFTNFTNCLSTLWADVTSQQMDSILVYFQVMFLPKCLSTLIAHMFLLAAMYLMDVGVETLVPASTDGTHLLLVEVGRLVVNIRFLLCPELPITILILACHRLLNGTWDAVISISTLLAFNGSHHHYSTTTMSVKVKIGTHKALPIIISWYQCN